jgi:hypothetical protein
MTNSLSLTLALLLMILAGIKQKRLEWRRRDRPWWQRRRPRTHGRKADA